MANGSQESEQWQGFVKEIKTNFDKSNEQLKSTVISQSKTQNVTINEIKASNAKIEASVAEIKASVSAKIEASNAEIKASVAAFQVCQDMSIAEIKTSQVNQEKQLASLEQMMQAILLSLKIEA